MASKRDDLIQMITAKVVTYMDTPTEKRKEARHRPKPKEHWTVRWFGMLPASLKILFGKRIK